jgi:hypothetical protein
MYQRQSVAFFAGTAKPGHVVRWLLWGSRGSGGVGQGLGSGNSTGVQVFGAGGLRSAGFWAPDDLYLLYIEYST